jgi:hypothetical protein
MPVLKDIYANFKAAALAGGATEEEIDRVISEMQAEDAKIAEGKCPACGVKITRTLDPRQSGPTEFAGKWFNYRCTSCRWFADKCEPVGEN